MANKIKYSNPIQIGIVVDQSIKDRIEALTDNITKFVNEAILSQLEYEEQARKVSK